MGLGKLGLQSQTPFLNPRIWDRGIVNPGILMGLYRWQMYINICSKIVGYHCSHYLANENDVDMCFSILRKSTLIFHSLLIMHICTSLLSVAQTLQEYRLIHYRTHYDTNISKLLINSQLCQCHLSVIHSHKYADQTDQSFKDEFRNIEECATCQPK